MMTRQKVKGAASSHHQAYSSSIEEAKASEDAVNALCSLSTLAGCAAASANNSVSNIQMVLNTQTRNLGHNSTAVTPESDVGPDLDRVPMESAEGKSREKAIYLSNLALKVIGQW